MAVNSYIALFLYAALILLVFFFILLKPYLDKLSRDLKNGVALWFFIWLYMSWCRPMEIYYLKATYYFWVTNKRYAYLLIFRNVCHTGVIWGGGGGGGGGAGLFAPPSSPVSKMSNFHFMSVTSPYMGMYMSPYGFTLFKWKVQGPNS